MSEHAPERQIPDLGESIETHSSERRSDDIFKYEFLDFLDAYKDSVYPQLQKKHSQYKKIAEVCFSKKSSPANNFQFWKIDLQTTNESGERVNDEDIQQLVDEVFQKVEGCQFGAAMGDGPSLNIPDIRLAGDFAAQSAHALVFEMAIIRRDATIAFVAEKIQNYLKMADDEILNLI